MRELKYYVACTVDGFIARRDGSFDFFLPDGEHVADLLEGFPETIPGHLRGALDVSAENRWFDTVVMGRATYEVGRRIGVTSPYPHLAQYVVSRTMPERPDPAVHLVSDDPLAAVRELKRQDGKDIWLCGGGALAAALFPEIDELILKVNPVLLGDGIPLFDFSSEIAPAALELTESRSYANGFMLTRYRVRH
jgi:dihydrofolate reductase